MTRSHPNKAKQRVDFINAQGPPQRVKDPPKTDRIDKPTLSDLFDRFRRISYLHLRRHESWLAPEDLRFRAIAKSVVEDG